MAKINLHFDSLMDQNVTTSEKNKKVGKKKKEKAHSVEELGTLENAKGICIRNWM